MKNLLNSTDIATLFLDNDLNVRRFTPTTAKIIKLIAGDVGRPITDIASDLAYPELVDDAREVLRTLVFKEQQASTRDGRWFVVRILPYRTLENRIDGVVITFSDAQAARVLEASLRDQSSQLRQMADALPNLVWSARPDGACDYLNRRWLDYTGVAERDLVGRGWLEYVHPDDRKRVDTEWRSAVRSCHTFESEFRIRSRDGKFRWFKTVSTAIRDSRDVVQKWYGTSTDVDNLKRTANS
jgi:two-component system, chemotaxis family, CheB/CheR fusion protein